jgi:hypothetical protein
MRRRLTLLVAATMCLALLAFVVPLALLLRTVAQDRATATAGADAQSRPTRLGSIGLRDHRYLSRGRQRRRANRRRKRVLGHGHGLVSADARHTDRVAVRIAVPLGDDRPVSRRPGRSDHDRS